MIPDTRSSLLDALKDTVQGLEAFERFVKLYRPTIMAWLQKRGLSWEDAEELANDILLKLREALKKFEYDPSRAKFRTWLHTVVLSQVIDDARRKARHPQPEAEGGSTAHVRLQQLPDKDPAFLEEFSAIFEAAPPFSAAEEAQLEALAKVKARVAPETWEAFFLRVVEKWDMDEVLKKVGKTERHAVDQACYRVPHLIADELKRIHQERGLPPPESRP